MPYNREARGSAEITNEERTVDARVIDVLKQERPKLLYGPGAPGFHVHVDALERHVRTK